MVKILHKISRDKAKSVLSSGLKLKPGGEDHNGKIDKTDSFLHDRMPHALKDSGVNRKTNSFCYLLVAGKVIDVESGKLMTPKEIVMIPMK